MRMDNNQFPGLPLGLDMAQAMKGRAGEGYEGLSEAEKEHIIFKCKDAKSKEEMDKIISSLSPDEKFDELFRGPGIR